MSGHPYSFHLFPKCAGQRSFDDATSIWTSPHCLRLTTKRHICVRTEVNLSFLSPLLMTSNESLFGLARQFQFAVGASQDLDIIVQIFRTVLHSANTLPVPTETKKGRPHKLTKAEKKKLQDEAELQQVVVRQMHILKLYENSTQQQPPQYSQCLP